MTTVTYLWVFIALRAILQVTHVIKSNLALNLQHIISLEYMSLSTTHRYKTVSCLLAAVIWLAVLPPCDSIDIKVGFLMNGGNLQVSFDKLLWDTFF